MPDEEATSKRRRTAPQKQRSKQPAEQENAPSGADHRPLPRSEALQNAPSVATPGGTGAPAVDGTAGGESTAAPEAPAHPDFRRLRRKGQDPTLDRGVDAKEMWRIFRIISEFVEAVDGLRNIRPAISIWGSARTKRDHVHYRLAMDVAEELSARG